MNAKTPLPFMEADIQPPTGWRFVTPHDSFLEGDYVFVRNVTHPNGYRIKGQGEYGWIPVDPSWRFSASDMDRRYWIRRVDGAAPVGSISRAEYNLHVGRYPILRGEDEMATYLMDQSVHPTWREGR